MRARSGWTRGELPAAPVHHVLLRLLKWGAGLAVFIAQLAWYRSRGGREQAWLGVKLRLLFEKVGGTAIKIGQQLSVRHDILPSPICEELSRLTERVPPLPDSKLDALLEKGLGRPVASVFSRLDREPIGSASVACVYRAWLHDGTPVVLKLRRPEVVGHFAADLTVVDLFVTLSEALTLVRGGMFTHLRHDLRVMLGEETDFLIEARYQRTFSKMVKRSGMSWLRAPKVFSELCTETVLVSEFVEGVPFTEVLDAVELKDLRALTRLEEQGIVPAQLARRLVRFSCWARFEATFFHADPHPGNIFIQKDNRVVMIDFGACGVTSARTRRYQIEVIRQFLRHDAAAISSVAMADLSPLPYLDLEEFRGETHRAFTSVMMAALDPVSHWSERIIAGVWIRMLEVTRRYQIRINLDTVRSIRSFLLYDTLAFRLDPSLGMGVLRRYIRESEQRAVAHLRRRTEETITLESLARDGMEFVGRTERLVTELLPAVDGARFQLQQLTRNGVWLGRWALRAVRNLAIAGAVLTMAKVSGVPLPEISPRALGLAGFGAGTVIALWLSRRAAKTLLRVGQRGPAGFNRTN